MLHLDTGNTGFMLLCCSRVMLMTPGLAFSADSLSHFGAKFLPMMAGLVPARSRLFAVSP